MRVYLAGPWVARNTAAFIARKIEAAGHVITHPWWEYEGENQDKEGPDFLNKCAKQDVEGVRTADVVIVYNSSKSEGKAVEQGLAIAWDKPIICITPGEKPTTNVFHYLHNYRHVTTVEAALEATKQYV